MSRLVDRLHERVGGFIERRRLLAKDEPVVVGVSGGADSMALLEILRSLAHPVIAVHVNYGLRGRASDADEEHVRAYCLEHAVPHFVHRVRLLEETDGKEIQTAARRERYDAFERIARAHGVSAVATAHHIEDQAETLLLNFFRGTGPEGIAGIPPQRPLSNGLRVVRPLLCLRRGEIEEYLTLRGVGWREDATNADDHYRRGFIRNRLMPLIRKAYGDDVDARMAHSAELMRGYVEGALRPEIERRFELCRIDGRRLDVRALQREEDVWRGRIILEALARWLPDAPRSADIVRRIVELLDAQPGRWIPAGSGRVWRERDVLRFTIDTSDKVMETALHVGQSTETPAGVLSVDEVDEARFSRHDPLVEYIDLDRVDGRLSVRTWRDGDRFQPLGMDGSRLVSDVLTDAGVPSSERRSVLVVEDRSGILWLVGHRLAHRARITEATRRIAKLSFNPG